MRYITLTKAEREEQERQAEFQARLTVALLREMDLYGMSVVYHYKGLLVPVSEDL